MEKLQLCDIPDLLWLSLNIFSSAETLNSFRQKKTDKVKFTEQNFNFDSLDKQGFHVFKGFLDIQQYCSRWRILLLI